jgi:hypothetical protein
MQPKKMSITPDKRAQGTGHKKKKESNGNTAKHKRWKATGNTAKHTTARRTGHDRFFTIK